ncbi:glycosyltransferase family 4 protein [Candidatus Curtissbacteria bacterium]|nr:glycosyltransferase family 4 protein [Candidatus Curtissbacteria bacterium]
MRVAFDISPLKTGHNYRGIGSYTENLQRALEARNKPFELEFIETQKDLEKFDLVHHPFFDIFFHTLPINTKTKRIITIHDVIPLVFPSHFPSGIRGNLSFFLQRMALRRVEWIISDSNASKNDIADKLNYPEAKITSIHLAASKSFKKITNSKQLQKIIKKYSLPTGFALYVGDVNWNKNVEGLLRAIAITKSPIVMVGKALKEDALNQTKELNGLIKKLDIQEMVIKTGYVPEEDLVAIYNLATATVLPSYYEGFGLPVIESMATGTPVVCSNNSSLSEITTAETAFYCDPENPSSIASKIIEVFKMKKLQREEISEKLQKQASKFNWDTIASQTIDIYQKLLEK